MSNCVSAVTAFRSSSTSATQVTREAVDLFEPELVIAPFLKRAIPR